MGKQNDNVKNQHGGKRPGSGAKKKAPTKVLSVRVLESKFEEIKSKLAQIIKETK
jgi:hypothetical protein